MGRGGKYDYFVCSGRQGRQNSCDLPYLPTDAVEQAVADLYGDLDLGNDLANEVRDELLGALRRSSAGLEKQRERQHKRVNQLEN